MIADIALVGARITLAAFFTLLILGIVIGLLLAKIIWQR